MLQTWWAQNPIPNANNTEPLAIWPREFLTKTLFWSNFFDQSPGQHNCVLSVRFHRLLERFNLKVSIGRSLLEGLYLKGSAWRSLCLKSSLQKFQLEGFYSKGSKISTQKFLSSKVSSKVSIVSAQKSPLDGLDSLSTWKFPFESLQSKVSLRQKVFLSPWLCLDAYYLLNSVWSKFAVDFLIECLHWTSMTKFELRMPSRMPREYNAHLGKIKLLVNSIVKMKSF